MGSRASWGAGAQRMEVPSSVESEDPDAAAAFEVPAQPGDRAVTSLHVDLQNELLWLGAPRRFLCPVACLLPGISVFRVGETTV